MSNHFKATTPIKLVIWDMDDTFWKGTLSEGEVSLIEDNIEIVKTLVDRGIMSSIVSKNDFEPVKKVLSDAGVWPLFIFPKISWNSKGSQIAEIIEQANLRPDNVLFIDDNSINIEEVRFRFATMMVAYPTEILPALLNLEQATGKNDSGHSRLKQYKQLERKTTDQAQSQGSNVDFLRQCNITLRFAFDIDKNFDRIIELINRSNQLNYTKVRVEGDKAINDFKDFLKRHDVLAAGVFASDKYGSHGLIGFYAQIKNERVNRLHHYVWSCRMMNAGLEQYVYERLGKPDIEVIEPVSNPIKAFDTVDWVKESDEDQKQAFQAGRRLLLIGSCDLTAVASYCSQERDEFVNGVKDGVMTRYDDFGFILGNAAKIDTSKTLQKLPAWGKAEFQAFQDSLASSDLLVLSLSAAMKGAHLVTEDGVVVRVHPEGLGHHIDFNPREDFLKGSKFFVHTIDQKIDMLKYSLDFVNFAATKAKIIFLVGANTRDVSGALSANDFELLTKYNLAGEAFCLNQPNWHFIAIDKIISLDNLLDERHYTRTGYLHIANYINKKISSVDLNSHTRNTKISIEYRDIADIIRDGRRVSRLNKFGTEAKDILSYVKQAVKMTPMSKIMRKLLVSRTT